MRPIGPLLFSLILFLPTSLLRNSFLRDSFLRDSDAAELLSNGGFEFGVARREGDQDHTFGERSFEKLGASGWYSRSPGTPDLWSTESGYVPGNFWGMTKQPLLNGRRNLNQLGMDVAPMWNEVMLQRLRENLGRGIFYSSSFWVARSNEDRTRFWFASDLKIWWYGDPAKRLFAALLPEGLVLPYASHGQDYEAFYGPYIKVSTDPSLSQYPADPTDRDWHQISGTFFANGKERIFALSSIPRAGSYKSYYFYDDVSLSCTPEAAFRFFEPRNFPLNGIEWQVHLDSALRVRPETVWNSKLSRWRIEEVDALGSLLPGGFNNEIQVADQAGLRENETFDLAPHVPVSDKARYYRITHLNSCVSAPAAWESQAIRWVLVPALRAIASVWNCAQEELEYHHTLDSGGLPVLEARATLLRGSQILESQVLPAQNGSGRGVFKNPHIPGRYEVRIEIQLAAGSGGVFNFKREFSFEMETPVVLLSGPSSANVGQTSRFEASPAFGLVSNPSQVLWSHQNESLQWVSGGNSSLQSQFAWSAPGTYGVRARAVWYPRCFADADTSIEVRDAAPEFRVDFGGKFSCSETGQLSGLLHLQDRSFRILGIEGRVLQGGSLIQRFDIDPALKDGAFQFNRPEAPGQYLLEIRVNYEILPGVQRSLLRQLPFQVEQPAMSLTGPAYLRAGEEGSYRAEHTGLSAPRIYWSYPGDGGGFYSAVPGGLTRSLIWKDRGSHEVRVDAIWNDACRASAQVNTRVIGQETVFFPDAFTPNGDQTNDRYGPKGQDMRITRFEIYDRWGAKVYSAVPADIEQLQGWDGTVQGKLAPDGVFVCVAEYESPLTHEKKAYRGTVTLLR